MTQKFKSEEELAKAASEYLAADGWDCYFEVQDRIQGPRADIVAVRGPYTAIVETKRSLGFAVLAQCDLWVRKRAANFVIAAVPAKAKNPRRPFDGTITPARAFAARVARDRGIGIWQVPYPRGKRHKYDFQTMRDEMGMTCFHRSPKSDSIRSALREKMKTQANPGTRAGGYVTPFTITCDRARDMIKISGGKIRVSDLISSIEHHYVSNKSARGSLVSLARSGYIPGVRVTGSGRDMEFELYKDDV